MAQTFLIETDELAALLDSPDLVLLDATAGAVKVADQELAANQAWALAHLPGSRWLDQKVLSDPASPYPYVALKSAALAAALQAQGITDGKQVVVYSASGYGWAARVWLLLNSIGFESVRILNGGLQKWRAEGRPLLSGDEAPQPDVNATLSVTRERVRFAGLEQVRQAVEQAQPRIVDALSPAQYRGEVAGKYGRDGHIATALNVPAALLIDADNRFKPVAQIQAIFQDAGVARGESLITYCGAGIAGSIDAFAALQAGWDEVRVYEASLVEWATNPDLPMTTVKN